MAKYLSPEAKLKRAKKRKAKRMAISAFLVALVLTVSYVIVQIINMFTPSAKPDPDLIIKDGILEPNTSLETEGEWQGFVGPIKKTINEFEVVAPDSRMLQLPENGSVDMSYFENVTFVGDSLTEGLRIYPNIENAVAGIAKFVSNKNLTPRSFIEGEITFDNNYRPKQNGIEAIVETYPGKIYITLGTNALTFMTDEQFLYYYNQMISQLQEKLPNTIIYVCSITPTTAAEAQKRPIFAAERLYVVNNQIAKMCNELGVNFVNLHEALAGEDGYLNPAWSGDGIHLKPEYYSIWVQYLMTHTVHRPDNPYIPGSPYYKG